MSESVCASKEEQLSVEIGCNSFQTISEIPNDFVRKENKRPRSNLGPYCAKIIKKWADNRALSVIDKFDMSKVRVLQIV